MLVGSLPEGWKRLILDYQVIGRHSSVAIGVRFQDGSTRRWDPPVEVWRLFARLRKGMYVEDRGSWFAFSYIADVPGRYSIKYNWQDEPRFGTPPTPDDFVVDQGWFPRTEEHVPEWFREKLASGASAGS
ncbi:hypothetical protein KZZ52_37580 [Dactylosporangium sp. AC04546]|uniref:hypothetical protein n=1 Tax=Dactylosporangium sp. AC04546 TaxID=2862460 RepID=UPI001EDCC321|nr:hypothetical protein [Dactylosporangium sp. AC04546]WVK79677.1 hypothetical protein KZZ52_37580 [Dactylosporangium sp. AC04546]